VILLIDTSSDELFIGLATPNATLLDFYHGKAEPNERGIHDARLAVETSGLFEKHEVHPTSIKKIGIVIGPGSFTGLRIGLSFAKGIVSATGAEIILIVTNELWVDASRPGDAIIVLPSYREGMGYLSRNDAPTKNIELRLNADIPECDRIVPDIANRNPSEYLQKMLDLVQRHTPTMNSTDLEPLYVMDFATGKV
jgi:tRNA A37 threonylcarbamoyladenosine modification protein TsaB